MEKWHQECSEHERRTGMQPEWGIREWRYGGNEWRARRWLSKAQRYRYAVFNTLSIHWTHTTLSQILTLGLAYFRRTTVVVVNQLYLSNCIYTETRVGHVSCWTFAYHNPVPRPAIFRKAMWSPAVKAATRSPAPQTSPREEGRAKEKYEKADERGEGKGCSMGGGPTPPPPLPRSCRPPPPSPLLAVGGGSPPPAQPSCREGTYGSLVIGYHGDRRESKMFPPA